MATPINPPFYFNTDKQSGHVTKDMPLFAKLEEAKSKRKINESIYFAFFDKEEQKYKTFQLVKPFAS